MKSVYKKKNYKTKLYNYMLAYGFHLQEYKKTPAAGW